MRVADRPTREQKRAQTRARILEVARRRFREQGFHRTSLDDVAEAAGYTKGAVYSNFAGKDELFLAIVEEHVTARLHAYAAAGEAAPTFEAATRAVAHALAGQGEREPGWGPVLVEFWAHASRREPLRAAALAVHQRQLSFMAEEFEALAARHGVALRIPAYELVRGIAALARGLGAERLLDPAATSERSEALLVAYVLGLTEEEPDGHRDPHPVRR
jgi:AcrR family transcriptional regulator